MLDFKLPGAMTPEPSAGFLAAIESERYDVIVVGGGPAGTTAVVYCCRKKLKTLLITEDIGGQMRWTEGIENYAGFQYITGPELSDKFAAQVEQFPVALAMPARVARLEADGPGFRAVLEDGRSFSGRAVILAVGASPRRLNVPGETELTGKGVTYCATCDAPLYAGRDVAVVGGGNSALTSVLDLAGIARSVYSIVRGDRYQADPVMVEKAEAAPVLHRLFKSETVAIQGKGSVSGIEVRDSSTGTSRVLAVDGVFVEIGSVPNSAVAAGLCELNPAGEIITNCRTETSRAGLFAAGDVTDVFEKQIIIAAGEGAKAALAAHAWLLRRRD